MVSHKLHVEARVDHGGHRDEGHERGQRPRPAQLHEIAIEKVALVRKVAAHGASARVLEQLEIVHNGAHDEREHVHAYLDIGGSEHEPLEDEHEAHVGEVGDAWLRVVDGLLLVFGRRRRLLGCAAAASRRPMICAVRIASRCVVIHDEGVKTSLYIASINNL